MSMSSDMHSRFSEYLDRCKIPYTHDTVACPCCGTPVSLTYLAASARKQLNAPSYAPTAPTIGLSYKLHNNTSIFLPRTFPLFPHTI